ncbi:uncharacterized protein LOC117642255 [Thrips palmi]|uniref:Uncharacterized protein LOC117642255 n=1 Tax=Thrips palmi TaxID=161013 RepID=A0A6P8YHR5_THRPL|nr:uncharacterized protein LOC117642255 [Thrips palmi]
MKKCTVELGPRLGRVSARLLRNKFWCPCLQHEVYHPNECLDVLELSEREEHCQELDDVLKDAGPRKVRRLVGVDCAKRPNWCQALLQRVAPHVELLRVSGALRRHLKVIQQMPSLRYLYVHAEDIAVEDAPALPLQLVDLKVVNVSEQHLLSVQRMPNLRKLALDWDEDPLDVTFPPLPEGHRGLEWLWVALHPVSTVLSLAKAHAATLQELRILCASEGDSEWHFEDLAEGLHQCGLVALRRVVLLRAGAPGYPDEKLPHTKDTCTKQKNAIWDELVVANTMQTVKVLCGECDECPDFPALGEFDWIDQ